MSNVTTIGPTGRVGGSKMANDTDRTPVDPNRHSYTPPVGPGRRPWLGVSAEEDQEVFDLLDSQKGRDWTGHTPVASLEFARTIARLQSEITSLHGIVDGLVDLVTKLQKQVTDELIETRKEMKEVLTFLQEQHKEQRAEKLRAAQERREARAQVRGFFERMFTPFVDDAWTRRGAMFGAAAVALVLCGAGYIQLNKDGVTVGHPSVEEVTQELEETSPRD